MLDSGYDLPPPLPSIHRLVFLPCQRTLSQGVFAFLSEALLDGGEAETYDFAYIDADKDNYIYYYELCMRLVRPGGIIAIDNVSSCPLISNSGP